MSPMTKTRDLRVKTSRPRLSIDEGVALFDRDLLELGVEADEMRRERVTGEGENQENDETGENPPHEERTSLTALSLSPDSPRSIATLNAVTSASR